MDDQNIIALFLERSESAIEEVALKYGKLCYSVANGILSSHEEAEECVNDTYLKTWNSIPPQKPTKLSSFLCKITRNLAIDRMDDKKRLKRGGTAVIEELHESLPDERDGGAVSDELALKVALNTFLRTLEPKTRQVFLGRYFYALSVKELASLHGFGISYVKVLLHRTRLQLKEHLTAHGIVL